MPRLRPILFISLLVMALTPFGAAVAGGPTSALLSVPGEGETASLYYTDPDYDALGGLVGIESHGGVGTVDESGRGHENGPGVTVTWLIHDVTPWRVDHIYLEGEGAPWIATQILGDSGTIWDSAVVWHQPESGAKLAALLDELGVGEASREAGDFSGVAGAPVPSAAAPTTEAGAPAEPSATSDSIAGIWWGLSGLVIGILLTMVGTVLWMRLLRAKAAQTDISPAAGRDELPERAAAVTEELAWPPPRA